MARFMALYMGSAQSKAQSDWAKLSEAEQNERSQRAMVAWGQWVEQHKGAIVDMGAPLGRTLMAGPEGIAPIRNAVTAYVIVEAGSHEAAAAMFENHPHFTLFPGTGVEVMECLPMPGGVTG